MAQRSIEERGFACRVLAKELYTAGIHIAQTGKPSIRIASGDGYTSMNIFDVRDELQSVSSAMGVRHANIQRALIILEDIAEEAAKRND